MPADIGPKIGIDGEKQFKSELTNINQTLKTLKSEMKAVTSAFDAGDKSEKAITAQSEQLNKQIDAQEKKMALLSKAIEEATQKGNGNTTATLKLKQQYADAQAATNELRKKMDDLGDETKDTGEQFEDSGKKSITFGDVLKANVLSDAIMSGLRALARAVKKVASAFAGAIKDGAEFADEIATMAAQTGLSTDELQEYKYMAGLVDVDLETITGSLARLTRNMNTARGGTGAAAEAFDRLGVNITNTDGTLRSNQEVFGDVVDILGSMANETERDAAAMAIFGRSAQDLNPLIEAGGEKIAAFAQEAHDMGYVLDGEALTSMSELNDDFDRMQNLVDSVKNQLAQALAPVISDLAEDFQEWVASVDWEDVQKKIRVAIEDIKEFFNTIKDKGPQVLQLVTGIGAALATWKVSDAIKSLAETFGVASSAIAPFIVGLASIIAYYSTLYAENTKLGQALRLGWDQVTKAFQNNTNVMRTLASQAGSWISTQFGNAVNRIKSVWGSIPTFFSGVVSLIKNAFSGIGNWFYSIGTNIVQGIWNGISGAYSWITSRISGWVSDVVSYIKRAFGIRSPSTVMRDQVGIMLARGVAEGFEDEMYRAAQTMTAAIPTPAAEFGGVVSGAVNGLGTLLAGQQPGVGGRSELVININGVTLARQTLDDFIAVARQRGMVVTV